MGGVAIGIQANPELSAVVVGGIRIVIDLAIIFAEFYSKLTDMPCQIEDYLPSLADHAKECQDPSRMQEAIADTYAYILGFCQKARAVFIGSDGKRRRWTSWRLFLRQQWEPFEDGFGSIGTNMQHHLDVLRFAGHVQLIRDSHEAKLRSKRRDREDLLNWLSALDFEEVHDTIYSKKHPNTGEWLLQTTEFQR